MSSNAKNYLKLHKIHTKKRNTEYETGLYTVVVPIIMKVRTVYTD